MSENENELKFDTPSDDQEEMVSPTIIVFFASETVNNSMKQVVKLLQQQEGASEFEITRNKRLIRVLSGMTSNSDFWDKNCQCNIDMIGNSFTSSLSTFISTMNRPNQEEVSGYTVSQTDQINSLFSDTLRFLLELEWTMDEEGLHYELEAVKAFALDSLDKFDGNSQTRIRYAFYQMPVHVLKNLLKEKNILRLRNLDEVQTNVERRVNDWEERIDKGTIQSKALEDALEKHKTAYNFVALHKGFNKLSSKKNFEKWFHAILATLLGLLIPTPIVAKLWYLSKLPTNQMPDATLLAVSIIPIASLVAILIYFFRISLANFKSAKSQILQIELRMTLCEFVQDYAKYAKEIKDNSDITLNNFEKVIFSNIVADEGQIPAVFDGVDQISKLVKAAQGK
ncbi:hypothetical protein [Pseudodesulfovibrio sp. zrk46]|uniref:hypothetical protein n=1 Tax=Pseudodesulfovibrio sp. zrk46 TaxID=2725288 RepID=UPI0014492E40|nr:hypothetical protein [Pseudodesulfovibrio sp. zrk46]QJB56039.1 hypothetical protein HFN16_06260 [Pseudodesulfovibrio sp. zrk46]